VTNIYADVQFLFRKCFIVGEAMSTLQKKIVCALNNKMYVAGIPCNLAKTFHCVSKYYAHETYVFMEFRVQQVNGLNHIFMIERKK